MTWAGHRWAAAGSKAAVQRGQPCALTLGVSLQITAQQIAAQGQPQKVTYATQPALKTQFLTTPISQAQKLAGTQQVQTQIQVSRSQRKRWIAGAAGTQDREGSHSFTGLNHSPAPRPQAAPQPGTSPRLEGVLRSVKG